MNHRGIRLSVSPIVMVWPSSCQSVEAQWYAPGGRADGDSIASVSPKQTPWAPIPARPTVRTEKSAERS